MCYCPGGSRRRMLDAIVKELASGPNFAGE